MSVHLCLGLAQVRHAGSQLDLDQLRADIHTFDADGLGSISAVRGLSYLYGDRRWQRCVAILDSNDKQLPNVDDHVRVIHELGQDLLDAFNGSAASLVA